MNARAVMLVGALMISAALMTWQATSPAGVRPVVSASSSCPSTVATQRASPGGTAVAWTIFERPATGCFVGFDASADSQVGQAALIDAAGTRTVLPAMRQGTRIRYELSSELLARARYPIVIDPLVSPSVTASVSAVTNSGTGATVATNGQEWIAVSLTRDGKVLVSEFTTDGGTTAQLSTGEPSQLVFTDRFHLVGATSWKSGTFADLVDGGSRPLPAALAGQGGVRLGSGVGNGLAVLSSRTLSDAGQALAVRMVGPSFEWDGGEFVVDAMFDLSVERNLLYVTTLEPPAPYGHTFVTTLDGTRVRELLLPDGGAESGTYVSNQTETLHVWNEATMAGNRVAARLVSNGVAASGLLNLNDGTNQHLAFAGWDGQVFRITSYVDADQSLREIQVRPNGQTGSWVTVLAPPLVTSNFVLPRVFAMSPADAGTLIVWSSGNAGQRYPRAFIATPGVTASLSGGPLFKGTNSTVAPFLSVRNSELFVAWTDTRGGGEAYEMWGRRFDLSLAAVDADSFSLTYRADAGLHFNDLEYFANTETQLIAPTALGFDLARSDGHQIMLHRLDPQGRPTTAELVVSDRVLGTNFLPTVAWNGRHTLITWTHFFTPAVREFAIFDETGLVVSPRVLMPGFSTPLVVLPSSEFLVVGSTTTRIISVDGGVRAGPFVPPPSSEFLTTMKAGNDELLAILVDPTRTALSAVSLWLDGGSGAPVPLLSAAQFGTTQTTFDGRNAYLATLRVFTDGGIDFAILKRFDDGGWSAPHAIETSVLSAIVALPDAGIIFASGGEPDPIFLQRITWLLDGEACGAPTDCESGFCVDGVCCQSACGGGAVDCQACSVSQGAAIDGQCRVLAIAVTCRPALSSCDVAEVCDGTSLVCPPDAVADAGVRCGVAAGACDVDDVCDGVTGACRDAVVDAGVVCRSSASVCDVAERCDGVAASCGIDLESDAGLPECAPAALTFITPPTARCDEEQTLEFSVTGRAAQLEFSSVPPLDVTFDGTTVSWTPHADRANGTLTATTGGRTLADVQLRSDCVPRSLTVGCGCSSSSGSWLALVVVVRLARRRSKAAARS